MAGEWREVRLADIATITSGKRPPFVVQQPALKLRIPVFGGSGAMGFTSEALFEEPVLVTGRVGTLGMLHRTPGPSWPSDNTLVIRARGQLVLQSFLYYALLGGIGQSASLNRGSSNPLVTQRDIGSLEVLLPPLPEQRAIAHILGTLDDKIELNRRMSETLEAMARALFKAWFVDFEPVRAKCRGDLDGRPRWQRGQSLPGLPAHLYDLFPDRLVDSELGEIPEGWEVVQLGDLAEVTSGKRPSQAFLEATPEAEIPLWGGNGPMGYVSEPLYSRPILLTGRVGTLGSVFRIVTPCWPSDNTLVVIAREQIAYEFLYFRMMDFDFDALNRGSTQPLLTQSDLSMQRFVVPSRSVLKRFHERVAGYFLRCDHAMNESRTLAALRDALLPKLIRGEIRVKDAERFVQDLGGGKS
jgi:type I restriction enzyme S subunit